ncbi:MAG: DUF1232 domain-containing protein [Chloroflexi bacterium]|nr:DUF1232 domain-containing protein [Chloroflexota bacterium]
MARPGEDRTPNKQGGRSAGGVIRRGLGLLAFLPVASRIPAYARLVWALALDDRMPGRHKALLGGALGYLVLGRDLVPDDVPLVGGLDDLVVVAMAVDLFIEGVPPDLLDEKLDELEIDRVAFDRDIAQIGRLTPAPVRNVIRRIPGALGAVGNVVESSGVAPRLRTWITREEPRA